MAHVFIRHKVNDFKTWKKEFDGFVNFRKSSGEKSFQILRPQGDSDNIHLLFEWDSVENAKIFLGSTDLKDAMNRAGVSEKPEIRFLEEVEHGAH